MRCNFLQELGLDVLGIRKRYCSLLFAMDPLSVDAAEIVDAAHLPCWASASATYDGDGSLSPKFPARSAINRKVALWKGQIWRLNADAVVNSTNETLSSRSGLCKHIIEAAGPDAIKAELEASDGCRTGEAVSTRSCRLPCKRLIHTRHEPYTRVTTQEG